LGHLLAGPGRLIGKRLRPALVTVSDNGYSRAMASRSALYGSADPRDVAAYRVPEVSSYLALPNSTLRAWFFGQSNFRRVLTPADPDAGLLSFKNLVEAHVLSSLRVRHRIPLRRVRVAIRYLSESMKGSRPLFDLPLMTDGVSLFVEAYEGDMVSASEPGQVTMRAMVQAYLQRIEKDTKGVIRLFPFTRKASMADPSELVSHPKIVVIDPRISFGRPVIVGTNIRTSVVAARYLAGESVQALAQDYRRTTDEIEEAIRCEIPAAA